MYSKTIVLKSFANITEKRRRWSLFLLKPQAQVSNAGVFLWRLQKF